MGANSECPSGKARFSIWRVVLVVLPLGIAFVVAIQVAANRIVDRARSESEQTMLRWFDLASPSPRRLDPQFADEDGNLVADPPGSAGQQISPDTLVFSYVAGSDAAEELASWEQFVAHLEKVTGRQVTTIAFGTTQQQLAALAKGRSCDRL